VRPGIEPRAVFAMKKRRACRVVGLAPAATRSAAGLPFLCERVLQAFVRRPAAELEARIDAARSAMQQGRPVLLLDDRDREDEADIIVAAERLTFDVMAQLIRDCSGHGEGAALCCVPAF